MSTVKYWAELAYVDGGVKHGVLITAVGGRVSSVEAGVPCGDAVRLNGLTIPGLANAHSHAFHRALRGRVHGGERGSFWTWRQTMYKAAERLDPDSYLALARALYAEMALAGITAVGEFHYLHHGPGGQRYDDPNAMGHALMQAAADAGIRITLLDTVYLQGGLTNGGYQPIEGVQERFSDGTVFDWHDRWSELKPQPHARIGAALHSVRAADGEDVAEFVRRTSGVPRHVHLSEQPAENSACVAFHGMTPTVFLDQHGFWTGNTTAVHATHLTDRDIKILGDAHTSACFCPTTERDLADGIGPAPELAAAGALLTLGSDQHAVIDLLEEARAVELNERLKSGNRVTFHAEQLLKAATEDGHASLGWPDAGRIAVGSLADFTTVALDSVRTAGGGDPLQAAVFAASAADVRHVVVSGREIVRDGHHLLVDDVPGELTRTIRGLLG